MSTSHVWNAKKVLLLEGKDLAFLRLLHEQLYPDAETPLDAIPNLSIGGWGGWPQAIGSAKALKNAFGETITTYCILDSDYHMDKERQDRYTQAKDHGINLHIWHAKEIENYLLDARVIARFIGGRSKKGTPTPVEVGDQMMVICEQQYETVFDGIVASLLTEDRTLGAGANKKARAILREKWKDSAKRLQVVSGKAILSGLSSWADATYSVSFGASGLARQFRRAELPTEMSTVLKAIEEGTPFAH